MLNLVKKNDLEMVVKSQFVGLIANADSSILKIPLEHGFKIEEMDQAEGLEFISVLEGKKKNDIFSKLATERSCINNKKMYIVRNSFYTKSELWNDMAEFDNKIRHGYLSQTVRLIRLFKEGNICIPYHYYYKNKNSRAFMHGGTTLIVPKEISLLENSDISDLTYFIKNTKLPFKHSYLELAFENFDVSYQLIHQTLAFLSLMISLEALFNPGDSELRYRIARNTASLLSEDRSQFNTIFSEIKQLYNKRSNLVHKGKSDIDQKDVSKLRYYVRESIKEVNKLDKSKDELLEILNSRGFN